MSWEAYSFLEGGGDTGTKGGKPHLGCNICKKNKIIRKDFNVEIKLKGLPSSLLIINLNCTIFKNIPVLLPSMGHLLPHHGNIYM